ncbi:GyrI-like domain-containing protein [Kribbella sp. NPDC050820]|uniref:GyrI-like domain-containing protein n=1 Tax=Kribbella sp. NPDC050820 TaxID=3155408 RepID=UPI0033FB6FD5
MRIESRTVPAQHIAVMKATLDREELGSWIPAAFDRVVAYLRAIGIAPRGMPVARYHLLPDHRFDVEVGFPVDAPVAGDEHVEPSVLPGGRVVVAWHIGPYERLGETYEAVDEWLKAQDGVRTGDAWEVYHDPPTDDPQFWRTEVVQPFTPAAVVPHDPVAST